MPARRQVALKLDGKPFRLPTLAYLEKVAAFLKSSPEGEVFTTPKLEEAFGVPRRSFVTNGFPDRSIFAKLQAKIGRGRYWGSEATIAELKRQVGE